MEASGPVIWVPAGMASVVRFDTRCSGRTQAKWGCHQAHKEDGAVCGSVAGTTVGESATWTGVYLGNRALLGLGLHQGFHDLLCGSQSSHRGAFVVHGCQIIVAEGDVGDRPSYIHHSLG